MEQEFKVSIGFRLFYGIVLLAVIIFFSGVALVIPQHNNLGGFLLVVAIVVPCIMMLINVFVSKVTISAQSINRRTLFGTKELLSADVKGCRIGEKVIFIDAIDGARASGIVVNNYIDFAGSSDLKNWLTENFPDLNGLNLKFEREKLLQNPKYGTTEQERKDTLKKARTIAIIYNTVGFLLMFAMIPVDNGRIAVLILMGYPLLGIVIMVSSRGLTKFVSSGKISVNPFVMLGFVWPAVMMLFKSLDGFTIYHYTDTFLPCLLITLGLFAIWLGLKPKFANNEGPGHNHAVGELHL
jgi:hypothetical protein